MLKIGDTFGDYKVISLLGQGGMGSVYLLESASGTRVAAKILDQEMSGDHESRKRFVREAQLALGVKHPSVVETYDVGEDPDTGLCYILMEYVPGGSLADRIDQGPLPIDEALRIVRQIASALELARQKGIVHRDIKPANIMFGADGTAKLADLGIARGGSGGGETTVTKTGMLIGTPVYMAPEQMFDAHNVDARADIYSLGVVFYEMLTGERPNKDDTVVQLMAKAMKGEPLPDVRTLRPEVSSSLAQLLAMMVAPDKEVRIATPAQIADALDVIASGGTFGAKHKTAKRRRRIPKALIPVGLVAGVAVAFAALALLREPPKPPPMPPPTPSSISLAAERPAARMVVVTNVVEKVVERTRIVTNAVEKAGRVQAAGVSKTPAAPKMAGVEKEKNAGAVVREVRKDAGVEKEKNAGAVVREVRKDAVAEPVPTVEKPKEAQSGVPVVIGCDVSSHGLSGFYCDLLSSDRLAQFGKDVRVVPLQFNLTDKVLDKINLLVLTTTPEYNHYEFNDRELKAVREFAARGGVVLALVDSPGPNDKQGESQAATRKLLKSYGATVYNVPKKAKVRAVLAKTLEGSGSFVDPDCGIFATCTREWTPLAVSQDDPQKVVSAVRSLQKGFLVFAPEAYVCSQPDKKTVVAGFPWDRIVSSRLKPVRRPDASFVGSTLDDAPYEARSSRLRFVSSVMSTENLRKIAKMDDLAIKHLTGLFGKGAFDLHPARNCIVGFSSPRRLPLWDKRLRNFDAIELKFAAPERGIDGVCWKVCFARSLSSRWDAQNSTEYSVAMYMAAVAYDELQRQGYVTEANVGMAGTIAFARKLDQDFARYDKFGKPLSKEIGGLEDADRNRYVWGRYYARFEDLRKRRSDLFVRYRQVSQRRNGASPSYDEFLDDLCEAYGSDWPRRWPAAEDAKGESGKSDLAKADLAKAEPVKRKGIDASKIKGKTFVKRMQETVDQMFPGWKLHGDFNARWRKLKENEVICSCPFGYSGGIASEHDVFTFPYRRNVKSYWGDRQGILTTSVTVTEGMKLSYAASLTPELHMCKIAVTVNGKVEVSSHAFHCHAPEEWRSAVIDLSPYKGRKIKIELWVDAANIMSNVVTPAVIEQRAREGYCTMGVHLRDLSFTNAGK